MHDPTNELASEPPLVIRPDTEVADEPPLVIRPDAEAAQLPPPKKPGMGFWEATLWSVIFLATEIFALLVTTGAIFVGYLLVQKEPQKFLDEQLELLKQISDATPTGGNPDAVSYLALALAWGTLAAPCAALLLIAVVLPWRIGRDWRRQLGVVRPYWVHVLIVLLLVPGFVVVPELIQQLFQKVTGLQPPAGDQALRPLFARFPWPLTLLAIAIGPAVVEEFWCRGFLGRGLCTRYGISTGVLLTSLFFAAMHMNPASLLVYVCMGAYLHFVYFATRSIWVPILLHAMNNGLAVALMLALPADASGQETPIVLPLAGIALLGFGSVALWTSRARVEVPATVPWLAEWKPEYPGISAPPAGVDVQASRGEVSPAALIFTVVSFGSVVYLAYRYVI